jgi:hypothetical protein
VKRSAFVSILCFGILAWAVPPGIAGAQDLGCQLSDSTSGPPRQILRCRAGPSVEAEVNADVHVIGKVGKGRPDGARVNTGAALIDVPHNYPGGFQVLAPRAIASVRGTVWIVDVQPQQTSVFVISGRVMVRRPDQGRGVVLNRGDGVDVGEVGIPLLVKRWPLERAAALLARFGR